MRQYGDPVEVRRGEAEDPDQFLWRGRLWKVRAVVAHWVETGPWWLGIGDQDGGRSGEGRGAEGPGAAVSDLVGERELWRVEAGRGRELDTFGVFDLSFDWTDGRWQLVGCQD